MSSELGKTRMRLTVLAAGLVGAGVGVAVGAVGMWLQGPPIQAGAGATAMVEDTPMMETRQYGRVAGLDVAVTTSLFWGDKDEKTVWIAHAESPVVGIQVWEGAAPRKVDVFDADGRLVSVNYAEGSLDIEAVGFHDSVFAEGLDIKSDLNFDCQADVRVSDEGMEVLLDDAWHLARRHEGRYEVRRGNTWVPTEFVDGQWQEVEGDG
jgi:hypothetical protein